METDQNNVRSLMWYPTHSIEETSSFMRLNNQARKSYLWLASKLLASDGFNGF
jgi:hypothetical protein